MLKLSFTLFTFYISLLSLFVNHPIFMALNLILLAFFLSMIIMKMFFSWFFYLLILVFLGGVMVIIMYMSSLAANEKSFYTVNNSFLYFPVLLGFLTLNIMNYENNQKNSSSFKFTESMYELEFFWLQLFCVLMLFFSMIVVVKLVKFEEGPLVKRL